MRGNQRRQPRRVGAPLSSGERRKRAAKEKILVFARTRLKGTSEDGQDCETAPNEERKIRRGEAR